MIYIDLDASVMRLLKRNSSPADLMHSPISKSEHSGGPDSHFGTPNMKSAWTVIFLAGNLLKFDIGVPEIDFS